MSLKEGGFTFLVASDLHYVDAEDDPWLERLIDRMNGDPEQPEFLLLLGDLTEEGKPEQLAAVRRALGRLAMPVYPVIGNHDYAPGDDRSAWDAAFPASNYRFTHRGWELLGLDTTVGTAYDDIRIPAATLEWLDRELPALPAERPLVLFTHFPLAPGVRWRPLNADDLLARFDGRRLAAAFSGHFHGCVRRDHGGTLLVNSRCCSRTRHNHDGTPEKGYLLCRAAPGGTVTPEFVPITCSSPSLGPRKESEPPSGKLI